MSNNTIRQSQVVTTYGPGALVDFPDHAVLIAGLDHWVGKKRPIVEHRLLANLKQRLGQWNLAFCAPPLPPSSEEPGYGVKAWLFPEWFVVQNDVITGEFGRSRPVVHRRQLHRGKYRSEDPIERKKNKSWPVVPMRFVRACPNGHIDDIPWVSVVHEGKSCGGTLWLDERSASGDLIDLSLRCDGCRKVEPLLGLQVAQGEKSRLGVCNGKRPWLGAAAHDECVGKDGAPHNFRLLVRHASNAYFPLVERAISIPDHDARLRKAVDALWEDFLSVAESADDVRRERKKKRVHEGLEGFSDDAVWAECERRSTQEVTPLRSIKDVELDTFLNVPAELGQDVPDGDFYAQAWEWDRSVGGVMGYLDRVVLVHRLREVSVQLGFTRFEPLSSPVDAALDQDVNLGVKPAVLALNETWLPAIENRGEGVFLALDPVRVRAWQGRSEVQKRIEQFRGGIGELLADELTTARLISIYLPYVLLHSLAHLLITAISLECGYGAASIRERIYVRDGAYGILLYTGTQGAEGTLGGLVNVGRNLGKHLERALDLGKLCSNDPVCSQHQPSNRLEDRKRHGAACHGCLLIAEPSCERRNELLDRALVVPTVGIGDVAFFG